LDVAAIELAIPKSATRDVLSVPVEPRPRAEPALLAVVEKTYGHGVSTPTVDDLAPEHAGRADSVEGLR